MDATQAMQSKRAKKHGGKIARTHDPTHSIRSKTAVMMSSWVCVSLVTGFAVTCCVTAPAVPLKATPATEVTATRWKLFSVWGNCSNQRFDFLRVHWHQQ